MSFSEFIEHYQLAIAVVLTVFGAVLGLVLQHYNVLYFFSSRRSKFNGVGWDIQNMRCDYVTLPEGEQKSLDLENDFCREMTLNYEWKDILIKVSSRNVFMKGTMYAIHPNGEKRPSTIKGSGQFFHNGTNVAYLYTTNKRKSATESVEWNCIYLLRFNTTEGIDGFWFTEDTTQQGRLVGGRIVLNREKPLPKKGLFRYFGRKASE